MGPPEGAKDGSTDSTACGLRMTGSVVLLFVWGATTRRANRSRMATAGGRRPPLPAPCAVCMGGLWPPARSGTAFPSVIPSALFVILSVLFVILSEAKNP